MDSLTNYMRQYGWSPKKTAGMINRLRVNEFVRPREQNIDHVQMDENGNACIAEIDPSTGKISYTTRKLA